MVSIIFKKNGFGPYTIRFGCEFEAVEWLRQNAVTVIEIEYIGG